MQETPTDEKRCEWLGTVCLVIGVLALGSGHFLGIGSWLLGNSVMQDYPPWHEQYRQARLGRTLGIIATVLHTLFVVAVVAFYALVIGFAAISPQH